MVLCKHETSSMPLRKCEALCMPSHMQVMETPRCEVLHHAGGG